ncbi:hypothetical protein R84B8_02838 [Treponema sp. R8-4-B8]
MANRKIWLGILVIVLVFGMTVVGCEDDLGGNSPLVGKWYYSQDAANSGKDEEAYEFTSNGKLLILGKDTGFTYTVSGDTITVKISGREFGTTTFSISGKELELSNAYPPLSAGTYYKAGGGSGSGINDNGVKKTLVIAGVPETEGGVTLTGKYIIVFISENYINEDYTKIIAYGIENISNTTVTIPLISRNAQPFTGIGNYFIWIYLDVKNTPDNFDDDTIYFYTTGKNPSKYNLTKAKTTIQFSQFKKQ